MSDKDIMPESKDVFETENTEKQLLCSDKKSQEKEEEMVEEKIGKEWWDSNWVWHKRSPYVTGELMDKLEPYIKKLETTPAWQAYDRYLRSIGPFTEELNLDTRWKIARDWYEREDPKAFWDKVYKKEEEKESIKLSTAKGWGKKYQDSLKAISKY